MTGVWLPPAVRAMVEASRFYGFRFGLAEDYPDHLMHNPEAHAGQTVFAATARMDAPYPDVQYVLPVRPEALAAYRSGDTSVLAALGQDLVEIHRRFLAEHGIPS